MLKSKDLLQINFYKGIIEKHIHPDIEILDITAVDGGCINNAQRISTIKGDFFIKWNSEKQVEFFQKEAYGLNFLRKQNIFSIPEVLGFGEIHSIPYLLLENIRPAKKQLSFWKDFGDRLAKLHVISNPEFGFETDNYIGLLTQKNGFEKDWVDFFIKNRLEPQIALAKNKKLLDEKTEDKFLKLYELMPTIIPFSKPSLIHGDLWNGNVMTGNDGFVCLLDPAIYYANREAEIAFTMFFGGFDKDFYNSYFHSSPLEPDFEKRKDLYNLYPLLVHVNLFGTGYLGAINSILKKFVK